MGISISISSSSKSRLTEESGLAVAKARARQQILKVVEVLLGGELGRGVADVLGEIEMHVGVVDGVLEVAHGRVRVAQRPVGTALADLVV